MKWKTLLKSRVTWQECIRVCRRLFIPIKQKQCFTTACEIIFTSFCVRWVRPRRVCADDTTNKTTLFILNIFYRTTHMPRVCVARYMLWPWMRPAVWLSVTAPYCIHTVRLRLSSWLSADRLASAYHIQCFHCFVMKFWRLQKSAYFKGTLKHCLGTQLIFQLFLP